MEKKYGLQFEEPFFFFLYEHFLALGLGLACFVIAGTYFF
jgi:hypothetical protein